MRLNKYFEIHQDQENGTWYIQDYQKDRVSIDYKTKSEAFYAWQLGKIEWDQ